MTLDLYKINEFWLILFWEHISPKLFAVYDCRHHWDHHNWYYRMSTDARNTVNTEFSMLADIECHEQTARWPPPPVYCYKTECWIPLHTMDVSGLKSSWHGSVSCFWTGSIHAQEWILLAILENYIGESLHKQEFSIDYLSPRWSFPMIPPKKVFFRWCSFH